VKQQEFSMSADELAKRNEELQLQLQEAQETIEAIRTGQVDALIVESNEGHQLFTLNSADRAYRVFIEKMTEGAVTLNDQGIVLYANLSFALLVRQSLSQVVGVPFEEFILPASRPVYEELFKKCWTSDCKGEVQMSVEEATPVQLSLTSIQFEGSSTLSIILTDLTAQKNAQQWLLNNNLHLEEMNKALEQSNHDLQQFASIASHDLQEPLRKIQIFATLLKETEFSMAETSRRNLQKIIDSSVRMKALIIDILGYSKLSSNERNWECVDLNDVITELKEDFELVLFEKQADIEVSKLPCLDVNKGQIRQVFQNIISNALKFARLEVPPRIRISARRLLQKSFSSPEATEGPFYLISIEDNGIGFDQKYVDNIFYLFERLNAKNKYEGTGIGLAIAKKIVEKHNGLITAEGSEGKGATFQIILPLTQTL
jgi:PAS domain S-box-containing protein